MTEEKWVWAEIPGEEAEKIRKIIKCPNCSEKMDITTKTVPIFGNTLIGYCDNCDRFFIREGLEVKQ